MELQADISFPCTKYFVYPQATLSGYKNVLKESVTLLCVTI